ncbi:hypothetical protein STENM327S_06432 [Streptomyces tendae]
MADTEAAARFYADAFGTRRIAGAGPRLRLPDAGGFRGFTLSLVVAQPGNVDALFTAAVDAGATVLKPAAKSLWGYGGVVQAPDGTVWQIATSAKKDTAPVTRDVDEIVLLLGVEDVKATKRFYVEQGLTGGQELRREVRRVRHRPGRRQALPLQAPGPRQGRGRVRRGHRLAPSRRLRRHPPVRRPGRLHLAAGTPTRTG